MYTVQFASTAAKDLGSLEKPIAQRILGKIRWMAQNFDSLTPEALTGQWTGFFKLRVGEYRALYTFDKKASTITVHFVRHRRKIYKIK